MPRFEFVDPRKLWINYVLALLLIFVLMSVSHFAAVFFGGDTAQAAIDINMSGRQRMLSQRILFFASSLTESGYQDANAAEQLRLAADTFRTSHETLVSEALRPLPEIVKATYFDYDNYENLDGLSLKYADSAVQLLLADDVIRTQAFEYLSTMGPQVLLEGLNEAVVAFEDHAHADAFHGELAGYIGYGLAVLALLAEAVFIFKPAHGTILQAVEDLEKNNDQLRQQEAEAFAALEDAEDAWMEAEMAKNASENRIAKNKVQYENILTEVRYLFQSLEMTGQEVSRGPMSDAQKEAAKQASRLQTVIGSVMDSFARSLHDTTSDQAEVTQTFTLKDISASAVYTAQYFDTARTVSILVTDEDAAPVAVSGDPASAMRVLIIGLRHLVLEEGFDDISLSLATNVEEGALRLSVNLRGKPRSPEASAQNRLPTEVSELATQFYASCEFATELLKAERDIVHEEQGHTVINLKWTQKQAVVRNASKKRKRALRKAR